MALETYSWGDIKDSEELGPKGSRITMPSKQGLGIAGYFWPADNPKVQISSEGLKTSRSKEQGSSVAA